MSLVRGKRGEVIRYAWLQYHAGEIDFATLCRVLHGLGDYPDEPCNNVSDTCYDDR